MMLLALLVGTTFAASESGFDDDGRAASHGPLPAEFRDRRFELKQLKAIVVPGPSRVRSVALQLTGEPGLIDVHLWRDIDSSVHAYVPFRHFEWDLIPPIRVRLSRANAGRWIEIPIPNLLLQNPQKLFLGAFVSSDTPRFAEDSDTGSPERSLLEIHDKTVSGRQPVRLYTADGDYLVRAKLEPLPRLPKLFRDVTSSAGLRTRLVASGIAWGDVDGDGWEDLLVGGRRLFANRKGKFKEITKGAGLADAGGDFGLFADIDNDGDLDLWVGAQSTERSDSLYLGDGKGHFTAKAGLDDRLHSYAGSWLDYDGNGLVDLFVANGWSWKGREPYEPDRLWRNRGRGRFNSVSDQIEGASHGSPRFSRVATSADLDGDGRPELFVGTFRLLPDRLWMFNQKPEDIAVNFGLAGGPSPTHEPGNGHALGANFVDFDNDGRLDLFVSNLMHPDWRGYTKSNESWMFRNTSAANLRFTRLAASSIGIGYEETPADPDFADFDNDGYVDAFVNSLYHSGNYYRGAAQGFSDETFRSGIGTKKAAATASCDFDRDGRLDLAVADGEAGLKLYRNVSARRHWLQIRLIGTKSNRSAIGAVARLKVAGATLTRVVTSGKGMGNSDSLLLHFGLGDATQISSLSIDWPGGGRQSVAVKAIDRLLTIRQAALRPPQTP